MKKKIAALALALLTALSLFAGCSGEREISQEKANNEVITVNDMNDLEDGGFYVLHNDVFAKLYVNKANYDISKASKGSSTTGHTLWFGEDWAKIPTMYAGDKLIYKSSTSFDELFYAERFEYVGYTVGLTKLQQTASGRYSFTTSEKEMNVNPDSDASALLNLPTTTCIIDRIGGADLRSGNISSGGCILGLEKDKVYLAEVYSGTYLNTFELTADSIALTSMDSFKTVDYSFLQSKIVEIHFPEYFNSGYYLINNFGLVRYVAGTAYDETTDFNIPNVEPDEDTISMEEGAPAGTIESMEASSQGIITRTIDINVRGIYSITVTYEPSEETLEPNVIFYDETSAYQLEKSGDNTLSTKADLTSGSYTLEITSLYGRSCSYEVVYVSAAFTSTDSTQPPVSTELPAEETPEPYTSTTPDITEPADTEEVSNG